MNKIHVTVVSLILGLSAALGIAAASDTVGLRASAPGVSSSELAAREKRLAKAESAIRKARRSKPPALPVVPAARASSGPVAQRVVFQRAASVASSSHGDDDDDDFGDDHGGHGHGGDDHGGDDD